MTGYEELALRAVLALEAANQPHWVDIGGLVIGLAQWPKRKRGHGEGQWEIRLSIGASRLSACCLER